MSKENYAKIPITDFISEKKQKRILDIIQKSDDVDMNYDRIEMILSDDFELKDLGTNRVVFVHKKKKYKHLIFKVAGDSHGIEANYREFYNGDLDKSLTYSYSISTNGVFVVQEKVERMTSAMMKENKKAVRKMLDKLSKKILLVDCKLSNFKNFGIRKNGDVCLLDHGDTIPLPKYQGNEIVNIEEESFVSLRCKKPSELSTSLKKSKPCGGKLKYSKDYDHFVCEKCGNMSSINSAYREFYGDVVSNTKTSKNPKLNLSKDFDPDEWKREIKEYCIETMSHVNKENKKEKGESKMAKTKVINGEQCIEIKGFYLPEPKNPIMSTMLTAVKLGKSKPRTYLEKFDYDPEKYKVMKSDHTPTENPNKIKKRESAEVSEYDIILEKTKNDIIEYGLSKNQGQTMIPYTECAVIAPDADFSSMNFIKHLRAKIGSDKRTVGCVFNENGFSIRYKGLFDPEANNEEVTIPVQEVKYVEEYAEKTGATVVKDYESIDGDDDNKIIISSENLNVVTFNGVECAVVHKYCIPLYIVETCENNDGNYEFPASKSKIKALLKQYNLQPKKFKLVEDNMDDEPIELANDEGKDYPEIYSEQEEYDADVEENNLINSLQNNGTLYDGSEDDDELNDNEEELVEQAQLMNEMDTAIDEHENKIKRFYGFVSTIFVPNLLHSYAPEYANAHPESVDAKNFVYIPIEDVMRELFIPLSTFGDVEIMDPREYFDGIYRNDGNNKTVSFSGMSMSQIDSFYSLINKFASNIAMDYNKRAIGIFIERNEPIDDSNTLEAEYNAAKSSFNRWQAAESGLAISKCCLPFNTLIPEIVSGDLIPDDHQFTTSLNMESFNETLTELIDSLDEFFEEFYDAHDDNDIETVISYSDNEISRTASNTILGWYIDLKRYARETDYDNFITIFNMNNLTTIKGIVDIIRSHDLDEDMDSTAIYSVYDSENYKMFFEEIKVAEYNGLGKDDEIINDDSVDDEIVDESDDHKIEYETTASPYETMTSHKDSIKNINLYTEDNNINNKDDSEDESENIDKEDDGIVERILEAIVGLKETIAKNNELIQSQDSNISYLFDNVTEAMKEIKGAISEVKENTTPVELNEELIGEIAPIEQELKYEVKSARDGEKMIFIDINDIRNKTIVVTEGDKSIVTNLDKLVESAIQQDPNSDLSEIVTCKAVKLN